MHALTAHSYPDRWPCTRGCRRQRPRVDVRREWARWRGRCCRRRRLHRPRRRPERGALCRALATCAMHARAPDHLLTLTSMTVTGHMLPQPRASTSTDACEPACRTPQALRPPRGCRKAAAEHCRGSHRGGRPGHRGCCRAPHGRAGRRRRPCRVGQHGPRAGGAPAAGRSVQGRRAAALLAPPAGAVWGVRASSRAGSPVSPTGGSERAEAARAVLPSHTGGG